MMRLALVIATDPLVDSTIWKSCLNFIQIVTVSISMSANNSQNNINDDTNIIVSIVEFCRPLVLKTDSSKKRNPVEQPILSSLKSPAINSVPLDLITLLRNHLLYSTGGSPNPLTSSKLRESCISSKQREQADRLFQTVILVIQGGGNGFNIINNDNDNDNNNNNDNDNYNDGSIDEPKFYCIIELPLYSSYILLVILILSSSFEPTHIYTGTRFINKRKGG